LQVRVRVSPTQKTPPGAMSPREKGRSMHPAIIEWWKSRQAYGASGECESWAGCGPGGGGGWQRHGHAASEERQASEGWGDGDGGGGGFGVRRPLRFLAYKLELDDRQVSELAKILDELKTERAQAEVDRRRSLAAFADAISGASFEEARAEEAGKLRVGSAERLRDAVATALRRIHVVLDQEQREKLAYLIRTGTLTI
jgi:Spy/CpxP family protein refolding chaperone